MLSLSLPIFTGQLLYHWAVYQVWGYWWVPVSMEGLPGWGQLIDKEYCDTEHGAGEGLAAVAFMWGCGRSW